MSTPKLLHVLMDGRPAGLLTQDRHGALRFTYEAGYRDDPSATPLSLSMPLARSAHVGPALDAFLWGLLPDNPGVLDRWAGRFQVSANSAYALLANVGEDCAGAAQFVRPDRLDHLDSGTVEWLSEAEVGRWLRDLRADPTAWQPRTGAGQFSLAGAQAKFALRREGVRWGRPTGREPTNVIVKPATGRLADQEINEHLCLQSARALGRTAIRSAVIEIDGERALVLDRYDRREIDGHWRRVHQEDGCQATGVRPGSKYQADGGPDAPALAQLLRTYVQPALAGLSAVHEFLDALTFSWLIGGTDAHAKNYSVLLAGPNVRLAPLYDLASALPYVVRGPRAGSRSEWNPGELSLAMSVAGTYLVYEVTGRNWDDLAGLVGVDPGDLRDRIGRQAEALPDVVRDVCASETVTNLGSHLPGRLVDEVARHVALCRTALAGRGPRRRRGAPSH